MSRWFRLYDEMLDDPKIQRLPPATFKAVVNLWCLASRHGGKLPCFDDIAFGLRLEHEVAVKLLDELVSIGLLDHDDEGLRPHNWDKRQYKSDVSTDRVQQFRERQRNVSETASATPPDTEQITDTEQKEKPIRAVGKPTRPEFDEFWKVYPKRGGANPRFPASLEFDKAVKTGADPLDIVAAAARYAESERALGHVGTEKVAQAKTWLHQRRWLDYPLTVNSERIDLGGFYAKAESRQLEAWDQYGLRTKGKRYARDRNGGWRFPTEWPPSEQAAE